ncbi:MAG: hypothetical protein ACPGD8_08650 [Flavobacteriales bacterium]
MIVADNFWGYRGSSHMKFSSAEVKITTDKTFEIEVLKQLEETINLIKNSSGKVILSSEGKRLGDYQKNFKLSDDLKDKLEQK